MKTVHLNISPIRLVRQISKGLTVKYDPLLIDIDCMNSDHPSSCTMSCSIAPATVFASHDNSFADNVDWKIQPQTNLIIVFCFCFYFCDRVYTSVLYLCVSGCINVITFIIRNVYLLKSQEFHELLSLNW